MSGQQWTLLDDKQAHALVGFKAHSYVYIAILVTEGTDNAMNFTPSGHFI